MTGHSLLAWPHRLAREFTATARIDIDSPEALKAKPLRERRARIDRLRLVVQLVWLGAVFAIGVQFVSWVRGIEAGRLGASRPGGVEAFLPISALLSLRHLIETGTVSPIRPAGFFIFLMAVATGLLMKRAFCSWVCPIGTLSEWLGKLSLGAFGRRLKLPRWLDVPLRGVKYLLLLFFVWAVFVQMAPGAVAAFLDSPYNRVADVKMLYFFERPTPLALRILAGLVVLSYVIPYFWCRYLCPYGGLLGVLSLLSPLKVTRHAPTCIDCGLCSKACPSHLPVAKLERVRSDECFGCLSCVAACPVPRALRVETPASWRRAVRPAAFAALLMLIFVGGTCAAKAAGLWRTSIGDAEYVQRVRELNGPGYDHPR